MIDFVVNPLGPGWRSVYGLLEAIFATVVGFAVLIIILGTLFLLVRFLLVGARAAKLYVAMHETPNPSRTPAPRTGGSPEQAAARAPSRPGGAAAAVPIGDDAAPSARDSKGPRAKTATRTPPPPDATQPLPPVDATEPLSPGATAPGTPRNRKTPPPA